MRMKRRQLKIKTFLNIAKQISLLSSCERLKVGAVITDQSFKVISMGYNGHANITQHSDCKIKQPGLCQCIHREQNRIMFGGHYYHLKNKKIFITDSPCFLCSKMIVQFGISQIYYINRYRDTAPLQYLLKCRVSTFQVKI